MPQFLVTLATDPHLTRRGLVEPEDHAHGRGLARPVGAEEPGDLARCDAEGQVVDGEFLAVSLGEALRLDHSVLPDARVHVSMPYPFCRDLRGLPEQTLRTAPTPRPAVSAACVVVSAACVAVFTSHDADTSTWAADTMSGAAVRGEFRVPPPIRPVRGKMSVVVQGAAVSTTAQQGGRLAGPLSASVADLCRRLQ